jgi:peptide/nickel transport system substrate-binding protein
MLSLEPARVPPGSRTGRERMIPAIKRTAVATALAVVLSSATAAAQKPGGILKMYSLDSPPSMSIHEETAATAERPVMSVFNNLLIFDQHVKQNSLDEIVPDLATSWSWSEDYTSLTFALRQGVKWHDGRPFTAADVKCTWDLLTGRASDKLRVNPRKSWYRNLGEVTTNGDYGVTFHLKRPEPAFMALLASGYSAVYPCHVTARDMRSHPIGTGPFKFAEFKPNESIKVLRNPDYWKLDRPYLDGIEYTVVRNVSTAILAFAAGKFDMTHPHSIGVRLLKDVKRQMPEAVCESVPSAVSRNLLVNREVAPFDNADVRRAMALSLDRKAFIDIITEGQGDIGGVMQPLPEGLWGMPPEVLHALPGYDPDIEKNRAEARRIVEKLGYGPNNRLTIKVSTRNFPDYRDAAVILIDQLKNIYVNGELETVDTTNWYPKVARKDYTVGVNLTGNSVDDPDQQLYENYVCGSDRNYTGYCNPELDSMVDRQSMESVARQYGLGFIPAQDEHYDFAIPKSRWDSPAVQHFRKALADISVREALRAMGFRL